MSPVFDENKYRALLERLEIREISFLSLSSNFRIDAEHYQKRYDNFLKIITAGKYTSLKKIIVTPVVTGHTPSMANNEFYGGNVPFIKTDNLREFCIVDNFSHMLTEKGKGELKNSVLNCNDVIITIIGATEKIIGRAMLIRDEFAGSCINQNIARIRLKKCIFSPEFITVYVNSRYGHLGLLLNSRQTEQVNLNCREVENLLIPCFSDEYMIHITSLANEANLKSECAKALYNDAQKKLLQELDMVSWSPTDESLATKSFAEVENLGRLDAEYYQPKYDEYLSKINQYYGGTTTVSKQFMLSHEQSTFSLPSYNYIEIGDIDVGNGEANFNLVLTEDLPANAKFTVRQGDILISKVRPYRGAVSIIDFEPQNLIASGAFTILREEGIYKKEVLAALLRTPVYRDWLLKWNVGSSYPVIKDQDILDLTIPFFPSKIQEKIAAKVQESFALRQESKRLLDLAKHAVEVAIEQCEDAGMKLLENFKNAR